MTVAILDTDAALEALASEWAALWRSDGRSAFQSPEWLLPWWAAFGTGAPRVAVRREGGRLVGVLPAYVLRDEAGPKLLLMGAGTTDYLDALGDGAAAMLGALLARCAAEGVARCDLMDVPPGSALRDVAVPGWVAAWRDGAACPVLAAARPAHGALRNLRLNRNRAERAGGWAVTQATAATLAADFATLEALHRARWAAEGGAGVLRDPAVLRFHALALPRLLAAGLLRLCLLHVGGTVAAASLSLLAPGRLEIYLSGYDVAQAYVSPGSLLVGAMLEQAVAEGREEAHFLRGRESYKYGWGAADRMNADGSFRMEG